MLVTPREWLSPWYNDCCYDRRREKTPPEAFQMDEKKSSTWSWRKRSAVLRLHQFGFCSRRKRKSQNYRCSWCSHGHRWRRWWITYLICQIKESIHLLTDRLSVYVGTADVIDYSQHHAEPRNLNHQRPVAQRVATKTNLHLQQGLWKCYQAPLWPWLNHCRGFSNIWIQILYEKLQALIYTWTLKIPWVLRNSQLL